MASRVITARDGETERCFGVGVLGHALQIIISYPNGGLGVSDYADLRLLTSPTLTRTRFPRVKVSADSFFKKQNKKKNASDTTDKKKSVCGGGGMGHTSDTSYHLALRSL